MRKGKVRKGKEKVEEKFERIFRVSRERRDEILVYDLFLEMRDEIWILGFGV